jgi:hypothetical protein
MLDLRLECYYNNMLSAFPGAPATSSLMSFPEMTPKIEPPTGNPKNSIISGIGDFIFYASIAGFVVVAATVGLVIYKVSRRSSANPSSVNVNMTGNEAITGMPKNNESNNSQMMMMMMGPSFGARNMGLRDANSMNTGMGMPILVLQQQSMVMGQQQQPMLAGQQQQQQRPMQ